MGVRNRGGRLLPRLAVLVAPPELLAAELAARGAHYRPLVQPPVAHDLDRDGLVGVGAGVSVVGDDDADPALLALVPVATRAPVAPLSHLFARPLLPHLVGVLEALGMFAVVFKGEVLLGTGVIVGVLTVRASDHHVLRLPGELLDVRAVVGEGHGAAVVTFGAALHVLDGIEILIKLRQKVVVTDQIAKRDGRPVVRAFGLQRVALYLITEGVNRRTSATKIFKTEIAVITKASTSRILWISTLCSSSLRNHSPNLCPTTWAPPSNS